KVAHGVVDHLRDLVLVLLLSLRLRLRLVDRLCDLSAKQIRRGDGVALPPEDVRASLHIVVQTPPRVEQDQPCAHANLLAVTRAYSDTSAAAKHSEREHSLDLERIAGLPLAHDPPPRR